MIRVHIGVLPTEEREQGSTLVENTADYPRAREQIYEALAAETSLDVFVLTRVCDDWFWDLVEYHGDVTQVNDAPTERLKRKLSVNALPNDLATEPELIIQLGLLDLPTPTEGVDSVWRWIVHHKLGEVWAIEEPSRGHFSHLVGWYIEHTIDPLLASRTDRIAQMWVSAASGKLRSAYARLFDDPRRNAYSLVTWRALAPYERELKEQWLADEGWYSKRLEDLSEMIEMPTGLPKSIRSKLQPKVQTHWNTRLKERFND